MCRDEMCHPISDFDPSNAPTLRRSRSAAVILRHRHLLAYPPAQRDAHAQRAVRRRQRQRKKLQPASSEDGDVAADDVRLEQRQPRDEIRERARLSAGGPIVAANRRSPPLRVVPILASSVARRRDTPRSRRSRRDHHTLDGPLLGSKSKGVAACAPSSREKDTPRLIARTPRGPRSRHRRPARAPPPTASSPSKCLLVDVPSEREPRRRSAARRGDSTIASPRRSSPRRVSR